VKRSAREWAGFRPMALTLRESQLVWSHWLP
jgi:hypothetical protein